MLPAIGLSNLWGEETMITRRHLLQTAGTVSEENLLKLNQWLEPARSYNRADYR